MYKLAYMRFLYANVVRINVRRFFQLKWVLQQNKYLNGKYIKNLTSKMNCLHEKEIIHIAKKSIQRFALT